MQRAMGGIQVPPPPLPVPLCIALLLTSLAGQSGAYIPSTRQRRRDRHRRGRSGPSMAHDAQGQRPERSVQEMFAALSCGGECVTMPILCIMLKRRLMSLLVCLQWDRLSIADMVETLHGKHSSNDSDAAKVRAVPTFVTVE